MFTLLVVALIIIAIGLVGTVLPGLPGMPLVLAGIALFAIGTEFRVIAPVQFAVFVVLGLLSMGLTVIGNLIGARKFGASRWGLLGAIVGLLLGLLLFGPFGFVIGPLLGAVAFELLKGRDLTAALRSGAGVLVGYLFGTLTEVIIALGMTAWFVWSTWGVLTGR